MQNDIFKTKVIYGIIGCGSAARSHAEAISRNKDSMLKAVYDLNNDRAKKFAIQYKCEIKPNLSEFFNDNKINAVIICTPHDTHADLVLKTLKSHKYCITEKPLYLNQQDQKTFEKIAKPKKLIIVFQVRFHKPVQFLLESVLSGMLGEIQFCSVTVRKNRDRAYFSDWHGTRKKVGGMLLNQGMHALDLMLKVCGNPVKAKSMIKNARNLSEVEDIYIGQVEFSNGAIGNIEILTCARDQKPENSILVVGSKGSIKISGGVFDHIEYAHFDKEKTQIFPMGKDDNGHPKFLSTVNDYILRNKRHPLLSLAVDGLRANQFADLLYKSVK